MQDNMIATIPAFPPIVLRVLDLLSNDDVLVSELVELIDSDAVFSSQILKVANSPLFGCRSQIDSARRAVVTLGFSRVQALAMSVATANYMKAALKTSELHRCWRHTLASAIISRELARAGALPADRAYTAGLLHDIGRLGLLVACPHEYAAMLRTADRVPQALLDQEKRLFGMDHCEAGRRLVEQWGLPEEFRVVAGRHHDRPSGNASDLLTTAYLACQLADATGFSVVQPLRPPSFDGLWEMLPPSARERFPSDAEGLKSMVERAINVYDGTVCDTMESPWKRTAETRDRETGEQVSTDGGPPQPMFTELRSDPWAWDFTVVTTTAFICMAVFLTVFYLWRP